jgi:hypothetical protein
MAKPPALLSCAVAFVGLLAFAAAPAHAQTVLLRGIVTDSAGNAVRDADVGIASLRRLTRTDPTGHFTFAGLRRGDIELSVRRIGYHAVYQNVSVTPSTLDTVRVILRPKVFELSSVNVTASEVRRREGIEDFHRRRVRGIGKFITLEEIRKRESGTTSDLLRSVPGLRVVRLRDGSRGVRFPPTSIMPRDCKPMIWLDGQKAPGLEVDQVPFRDIEGIEVYNGPSTTPMQFSQAASSYGCGTIVIWSRQPG